MAIVNYTTKVPVTQTVGEIQAALGEAGADRIAITYADRQPTGVSFVLQVAGDRRQVFTLPVDVAGMAAALARQQHGGSAKTKVDITPAHAAKVAWRVVKDWLLAQLSMVEAGQARLDQVMLPYLHVDTDVTLYEAYVQNGRAALPAEAGPA